MPKIPKKLKNSLDHISRSTKKNRAKVQFELMTNLIKAFHYLKDLDPAFENTRDMILELLGQRFDSVVLETDKQISTSQLASKLCNRHIPIDNQRLNLSDKKLINLSFIRYVKSLDIDSDELNHSSLLQLNEYLYSLVETNVNGRNLNFILSNEAQNSNVIKLSSLMEIYKKQRNDHKIILSNILDKETDNYNGISDSVIQNKLINKAINIKNERYLKFYNVTRENIANLTPDSILEHHNAFVQSEIDKIFGEKINKSDQLFIQWLKNIDSQPLGDDISLDDEVMIKHKKRCDILRSMYGLKDNESLPKEAINLLANIDKSYNLYKYTIEHLKNEKKEPSIKEENLLNFIKDEHVIKKLHTAHNRMNLSIDAFNLLVAKEAINQYADKDNKDDIFKIYSKSRQFGKFLSQRRMSEAEISSIKDDEHSFISLKKLYNQIVTDENKPELKLKDDVIDFSDNQKKILLNYYYMSELKNQLGDKFDSIAQDLNLNINLTSLDCLAQLKQIDKVRKNNLLDSFVKELRYGSNLNNQLFKFFTDKSAFSPGDELITKGDFEISTTKINEIKQEHLKIIKSITENLTNDNLNESMQKLSDVIENLGLETLNSRFNKLANEIRERFIKPYNEVEDKKIFPEQVQEFLLNIDATLSHLVKISVITELLGSNFIKNNTGVDSDDQNFLSVENVIGNLVQKLTTMLNIDKILLDPENVHLEYLKESIDNLKDLTVGMDQTLTVSLSKDTDASADEYEDEDLFYTHDNKLRLGMIFNIPIPMISYKGYKKIQTMNSSEILKSIGETIEDERFLTAFTEYAANNTLGKYKQLLTPLKSIPSVYNFLNAKSKLNTKSEHNLTLLQDLLDAGFAGRPAESYIDAIIQSNMDLPDFRTKNVKDILSNFINKITADMSTELRHSTFDTLQIVYSIFQNLNIPDAILKKEPELSKNINILNECFNKWFNFSKNFASEFAQLRELHSKFENALITKEEFEKKCKDLNDYIESNINNIYEESLQAISSFSKMQITHHKNKHLSRTLLAINNLNNKLMAKSNILFALSNVDNQLVSEILPQFNDHVSGPFENLKRIKESIDKKNDSTNKNLVADVEATSYLSKIYEAGQFLQNKLSSKVKQLVKSADNVINTQVENFAFETNKGFIERNINVLENINKELLQNTKTINYIPRPNKVGWIQWLSEKASGFCNWIASFFKSSKPNVVFNDTFKDPEYKMSEKSSPLSPEKIVESSNIRELNRRCISINDNQLKIDELIHSLDTLEINDDIEEINQKIKNLSNLILTHSQLLIEFESRFNILKDQLPIEPHDKFLNILSVSKIKQDAYDLTLQNIPHRLEKFKIINSKSNNLKNYLDLLNYSTNNLNNTLRSFNSQHSHIKINITNGTFDTVLYNDFIKSIDNLNKIKNLGNERLEQLNLALTELLSIDVTFDIKLKAQIDDLISTTKVNIDSYNKSLESIELSMPSQSESDELNFYNSLATSKFSFEKLEDMNFTIDITHNALNIVENLQKYDSLPFLAIRNLFPNIPLDRDVETFISNNVDPQLFSEVTPSFGNFLGFDKDKAKLDKLQSLYKFYDFSIKTTSDTINTNNSRVDGNKIMSKLYENFENCMNSYIRSTQFDNQERLEHYINTWNSQVIKPTMSLGKRAR